MLFFHHKLPTNVRQTIKIISIGEPREQRRNKNGSLIVPVEVEHSGSKKTWPIFQNVFDDRLAWLEEGMEIYVERYETDKGYKGFFFAPIDYLTNAESRHCYLLANDRRYRQEFIEKIGL